MSIEELAEALGAACWQEVYMENLLHPKPKDESSSPRESEIVIHDIEARDLFDRCPAPVAVWIDMQSMRFNVVDENDVLFSFKWSSLRTSDFPDYVAKVRESKGLPPYAENDVLLAEDQIKGMPNDPLVTILHQEGIGFSVIGGEEEQNNG